MEDKKKCAHATCTCWAMPMLDYCCNECRDAVALEKAGEEPMTGCHCHHTDCGGETEIEPVTQGLSIASEALGAA